MKIQWILTLMLMTIFSVANCGWHAWEEPPKENELIMVVDLRGGEIPERRQILIVTEYTSQFEGWEDKYYNGWGDVNEDDLLEWINTGIPLISYSQIGIKMKKQPQNISHLIEEIRECLFH